MSLQHRNMPGVSPMFALYQMCGTLFGPSTSKTPPCPPPISPTASVRYVPISPGSVRMPPLSPATSLSRWNSSKDLWIGEETKRNMPPHVYKYYWQRTMCYRRQSLTKV
ncbi:hypothetical protein ABEB36_004356 [Hypothenemus hampei]|uniref:Uncharacterized protein n=1 Tax=Hypothenemus hampei TaxID=57062 RepID=A0ABD1F4K3_HYPHA